MTEIKDKDLEKAAGGTVSFRKPGGETVHVNPTDSCAYWSIADNFDYRGQSVERICKSCRFYDPAKSVCKGINLD